MPSPTQNYWDKIADLYQQDTHIDCDDFHFGPLIPGDSCFKLLPEKLEGMDCLELGAGAAQNSIFLAAKGADCVAVDISPKQLKHAETLANKANVALKTHQADIETFTCDRQFSLVHSCHALSFTAHPLKTLKNMCQFVAPGGKLILATQHPLAGGEWVNLEDEDGLLLKDYFNPIPDCREAGKGARSASVPSTIQDLVTVITQEGLYVDAVLEPKCDLPKKHGKYDASHVPYWSETWLEHADELSKIPFTVIIAASRPKVIGTRAQHEPDTAELAAKINVMKLKAKTFQAARDFFNQNDFLEVFTPVRIPAPALEDYIDAEPSGSHWLRTSPELHMKRLIAAGIPRIFQIGPCFRMGENGSRHLPEFQMLEWYRRNDHWLTVLQDTKDLLAFTAKAVLGSTTFQFRGETIDLQKPWEHITVQDAFKKYADTDLDKAIEDGEFESILCQFVEPNLGHGVPTVLTEYPLACSGLSQPIPDKPNRVERWELYVAGLELGNACSELVDPEEQLKRFQNTAKLRQDDDREVYPIDQPFMDAINAGIPPSAGVAIGFDRFVMMLANLDDIHQVAFN